jgi:hypothetical protein
LGQYDRSALGIRFNFLCFLLGYAALLRLEPLDKFRPLPDDFVCRLVSYLNRAPSNIKSEMFMAINENNPSIKARSMGFKKL